MSSPSVLIVDDLPAVHEMLEAVIEPAGFASSFSLSGDDALRRYRESRFDVVLVDIAMQPMDGLTLLKELKAYDPDAVVVMMTGYSSADNAMRSLKFGAFDYVQKPFRVDELVKTLRRGVETRRKAESERQRRHVESSVERPVDLADALLGDSPAIEAVRVLLAKIARARTPVLVVGEPGTGRRAVADQIHLLGPTPEGPFRGVDCKLAKPEELREGLAARNGMPGFLFSEAAGGTLFLNNLEELPHPLQAALAGVMEVGARDVRLVVGVGANLEGELDEGRLQDDLAFRVSSLPIHLPPLRDRREDIPVLVADVLSKAANPYFDSAEIRFNDEARDIFDHYPWPGNVTELSNVVCTIVALAQGRVVGPELLPRRLKEVTSWPKMADYLAERERQYLRTLLRACGNDKRRAARIAGITDFPPFL